MNRFGLNAPTSGENAFAAELAKMRDRIADLERAASRGGNIVAAAVAVASTWTNATTAESQITVVTGDPMSLTLALNPSRLYKLCFNGRFLSTVNDDVVTARFVEGGVNRKSGRVKLSNLGDVTLHNSYLLSPASSAPVAYTIAAARLTGTGTISAQLSVASPMEFWVEDLGIL